VAYLHGAFKQVIDAAIATKPESRLVVCADLIPNVSNEHLLHI